MQYTLCNVRLENVRVREESSFFGLRHGHVDMSLRFDGTLLADFVLEGKNLFRKTPLALAGRLTAKLENAEVTGQFSFKNDGQGGLFVAAKNVKATIGKLTLSQESDGKCGMKLVDKFAGAGGVHTKLGGSVLRDFVTTAVPAIMSNVVKTQMQRALAPPGRELASLGVAIDGDPLVTEENVIIRLSIGDVRPGGPESFSSSGTRE